MLFVVFAKLVELSFIQITNNSVNNWVSIKKIMSYRQRERKRVKEKENKRDCDVEYTILLI